MLHVWFLYFFVWGGQNLEQMKMMKFYLLNKVKIGIKEGNKDINTVDILHALTIFGIN